MAAAALTNTATVSLSIGVSEAISPVAGSNSQSKSTFNLQYIATLANGAGGTAGNTDQYYAEVAQTLAAGATTNIDLQALVDNIGRSISFARVLGIVIYVTGGTLDQKLEVYQYATTDPWSGGPFPSAAPGVAIPAQSVYMQMLGTNEVAGWPVTSTSNTFTLSNTGSAAMTYTLGIIGTFE